MFSQIVTAALIKDEITLSAFLWQFLDQRGKAQRYGYAENEVIGQPISILVPGDRRDEAS